jgi:hypothetical protein
MGSVVNERSPVKAGAFGDNPFVGLALARGLYGGFMRVVFINSL